VNSSFIEKQLTSWPFGWPTLFYHLIDDYVEAEGGCSALPRATNEGASVGVTRQHHGRKIDGVLDGMLVNHDSFS
jgi:hypothetical protein